MSDEGDRPAFVIEEDGDVRSIIGRHFAVSFAHVDGRWHHSLLHSRHPWGPREMFAGAVEWDAGRDDPRRVVSPVFQELQLAIDPQGRGQALLVGMSGRHHFSASFLMEESEEEILLSVDVADRCREPSYLSSTYAVVFGSDGMTAADESAISWDRTYYRLTFAAGPSTRIGMAESGRLAVLVQAGADSDLDGPTRRCRYSWGHTHAASRPTDAGLSGR